MYCVDFFRKWKKEGNFCGLDKGQVSRLNAYMDIVEQLVKQKIPEERIFENFSVSAATPLIAARGEAHTEGLNFVTSRLKEGKKVTNNDIQTTLKSCSTTTSEPVKKVVREKKPELVKTEKPVFPEHVPPAAVTVPLKADPAKPPQPSLAASGRLTTCEEQPDPGKVTETTWSPLSCPTTGGTCPDGLNHVIKGSKDLKEKGIGLGDKCNLSGGFIRDQKFCPYLERQKRAATQEFTTGAGAPSPSSLPVKSRYPRLLRDQIDTAAEKFVDDCLSDKYHRIIERAMSERPRECPKPLDVICSALMRYEEYLDGGCE